MRIVSFLFAFAMIGFAIVQYNDPDGWLWAIIYGITMMFCFARAMNKSVSGGLAIIALAFLVSGLLRWSYVDVNWINIEEAREGLGCFIVALATGIFALSKPKSKRYF